MIRKPATRRHFLLLAGATLATAGLASRWRNSDARPASTAAPDVPFAVVKTDAQWRAALTPEQFNVLRKAGTERPYSSDLNNEHRSGRFHCAGCGQAAFLSRTKFDSHTGWPSFWAPIDQAVATTEDRAFGWTRTEVHCDRCGGHLGHVFNDGPQPTGLRYCMNGVALQFTQEAV